MTKRTLDDLKSELLGVVRGEREPTPPPPAPSSPGLLTTVQANLDLMRIIGQVRPESVSKLAEMAGRAQSNVSRSLQELARYGLVRLVRDGKAIRPELAASHVDVDLVSGACHVLPHATAAE